MKYILMRTVSGKTYYARTEKNNAIKKTEDIALAQRFASEKDAKKMRDRASRKLNGYKIHPVPDKSQADLRDSKIQMTDATPSVSNPPAGISSSSTENVSLHRSGLRYTTKQKVIVLSAENLSHIPISLWITSSRLQKAAAMICQTFNVPAASATVSSRTYFRKIL